MYLAFFTRTHFWLLHTIRTPRFSSAKLLSIYSALIFLSILQLKSCREFWKERKTALSTVVTCFVIWEEANIGLISLISPGLLQLSNLKLYPWMWQIMWLYYLLCLLEKFIVFLKIDWLCWFFFVIIIFFVEMC